jgi:XTP/dITP diphosphohydrolase
MMQLLIATANKGKVREIAHELIRAGLMDIEPVSLHELPAIPEPVEDQPRFSGNAVKKALHYAAATGLVSLADDSGLCVDALNGAPGVLSARYAGEPCDDAANNRKLIAALAGVAPQQRTARFVCCLALAAPQTVLALVTDEVAGVMVDEARGTNGFGYDPHFFLPELGKTTAELSMDHKSQLSHRGKAVRHMIKWIGLFTRCSNADSTARG